MKILVIGGTGFIGSHVTRQLAALGHEVRVYVRGERPYNMPEGVRKVNAYLDDMRRYAEILQKWKFDVVVHLIAMNRFEAHLAVEVFSGHAGRIVVASSQDVYAAYGALLRHEEREPTTGLLNEQSPMRTSRYLRGGDEDYEKFEVEEVFYNASDYLPLTLLRLPTTYGPDDGRQRFYPFIKRMDDQRPAILLDPDYGNFKSTHAYVENVAHAITLAATKEEAAQKIYNVGESASQKTMTVAERLHMLAAAAKYRGKIVALPKDICPPHLQKDFDFRHDLMVDDSLIRKELGYAEIVPLEEGFRRTVEWQRTVCPLSINPDAYNYAVEDALIAEHQLVPGRK